MYRENLSDYAAEARMIYAAATLNRAFAWWRGDDGLNRVTPHDEVPHGAIVVRFTRSPSEQGRPAGQK